MSTSTDTENITDTDANNEEFNADANNEEFNTDNPCIICMEPLIENIRILQCLHKYHNECINKWINTTNKCPICKFPTNINITNVNENGEYLDENGLQVKTAIDHRQQEYDDRQQEYDDISYILFILNRNGLSLSSVLADLERINRYS